MPFAGFKAVGESISTPLRYYGNNVYATIQLIQAMERAMLHTLIFFIDPCRLWQPSHPNDYIPYGRCCTNTGHG